MIDEHDVREMLRQSGATFAGVDAVRTAPVPADDSSAELGMFAPVGGRVVDANLGTDRGYGPASAVDPSGPTDTTEGLSVVEDVVSSLVRLGLEDAVPLGWSSDGFALDADAPPPRVLPAEAEDQLADLGVDRRSARTTATKSPFPPHELPVPAKQRLGRDQELRPPVLGE